MSKIIKTFLLVFLCVLLSLTAGCKKKHECDFAELVSSETGHYYQCECGESKEEEPHTFGSWTTC